MCPNEFLEIVVPNCSRGCVRLVGFVLYETLRWIKEDGTPNQQEIAISFNELIRKARISRGAAAAAKQEAVNGNFLEIIHKGQAKRKGDCGSTEVVRLKWSQNNAPAKGLETCQGFYAGTGHFTAMPHSYFSKILGNETLAAIKFVSVVFRHTVGYQTQFGRRKSVPLSFRNLHRLTGIGSPATLSKTIRHCLNSNYIELVELGNWKPGDKHSKSSVYGPKYQSVDLIGSKSVAEKGFKKCSRQPTLDQFKNCSPIGTKPEAEHQFKKCSPIKKLKTNTETKLPSDKKIQLLTEVGFKPHTAETIAKAVNILTIEDQIRWMRYRGNHKNFLAFLRKAILENWEEPEAAKVKRKTAERRAIELANESKTNRYKKNWNRETAKHRKRLQTEWFSLDEDSRERIKHEVIADEAESCRNYLRKKKVTEKPPVAFLNGVAKQLGIPTSIEFERKLKNTLASSPLLHE